MNVAVIGTQAYLPGDVQRAVRASNYHATRLREVQSDVELRGAEAVVVLWDGKDTEVRRMLGIARSLGVPVHLNIVERKP